MRGLVLAIVIDIGALLRNIIAIIWCCRIFLCVLIFILFIIDFGLTSTIRFFCRANLAPYRTIVLFLLEIFRFSPDPWGRVDPT